jgi:hypothetical protein
MFSGMKLYAVLVLGVAVIGGGAYVLYSNGGSTPLSQEEGGLFSGTGKLAALLGSERPMKCTFSQTDEGTYVEGVWYVAGERMRGDYVMTEEGERYESGMYSDGVTMYSWSDTPEGLMGTKFTLTKYEEVEYDEYDGEYERAEWDDELFGVEDEVEYECEPWRVDESLFTVPDGIEFMDMTAMMEASFDLERDGIENFPPAAPNMADLPGLDCSICADLPSGPREACLESLSCVE